MSEPNASAGAGGHETRTEIRYGETDQMGYAHLAVAVSWFELGRVVLLRELGFPYRELEAQGVLLPAVRMELRYHAPGRFEDALAIQTKIAELGRSRVVFENRVWRIEREGPAARTLLVEGRVELACVDRRGQIQRLPEEVRAKMAGIMKP